MKALWLLALCAWGWADTVPPPAPPPTAPAPARNNNGEAANDDIAKELQQYQNQAEQVLNQVQKLADKAPVSPAQLDATKEKALKLANDDQFLRSVEALWKSERRDTLLLIQLGFFLFMLLFKAWRQSKARNWFTRLLIGGACWAITWAGMLYLIPLAVLGEPFLVLTGTLWRVLVLGQ